MNLSTLQMIYFTVVFKFKGPDLIFGCFISTIIFQLYLEKSCYLTVVSMDRYLLC